MKKTLIIMLAAVFLLTGAVSAQTEWVTENRIGNPDAENVITMTIQQFSYWTSSYEGRANYLKEAYEAWARRNPDYQIRVTLGSKNIGEGMVKIIEQAKVGNEADIAQIDSFFLPRFYPYLKSIDNYLTEEEKNDFFGFVREGMTNNDGEIVAIWNETDVRGLYYRKDLVPEAPETWDELIDVASEISAADNNVDGYVFPAGRGEGTTFSILPFYWAQGGKLVDETGRPVFNEGENREYFIDILNFLEELVASGASPSRVTSYKTLGEFNNEVAAKSAAMFPGGNWQKNMFYDIVSEEEADKWEIAPLPQKEANMSSSGSGGWVFGIFTEDEGKKAAAVRFIKEVYMNPEWFEISGYLPTRNSVFENYYHFRSNKYQQQFQKFLQTSDARPGFPIYPTISSEIQVAVADVITGSKTPEEALDNAWDNVMEQYESM